MGPGLDCPGKRRTGGRDVCVVDVASMGPGLDCPGKPHSTKDNDMDPELLQWGQGWIALEHYVRS